MGYGKRKQEAAEPEPPPDCYLCGIEAEPGEFELIDCPECGEAVCENCWDEDAGKCWGCCPE